MKKRREATQTDELIRQLDSAFDKRRTGDCVGALSIFESLERQSSHPKDIAGLRLFQVMCLTDLGRVDKAYEQIRRVDEKRLEVVDRIDYESEYANIKRAQGMTSAALERIERALKLSETVEDKSRVEDARRSLHALRAVLLAESGKCDEAVPLLEEIPAENPWWTEARICLGDCKIRKKSYREAIEVYRSVVSSDMEVDPIHRQTALRNIGCAYYYNGEYTKGLEYLKRVEHGYDENPALKAELYNMLASTYSHLGMTEEADRYAGFSRGSDLIQ